MGNTLGAHTETPDKIVYHYTTLQGLLGITESKNIWATNILYLNDASELHYAKAIFREELAEFRRAHPEFDKTTILDDSLGHFFLETIEDNINALLPSQDLGFFVCSFSEECDLLSQWRGYCKNGNGFSLGFSLNQLEIIARNAHYFMRQCLYDRGEQARKIQKLLSNIAAKFGDEIGNSEVKKEAWNEKSKMLLTDFIFEFIKLAPLLKHPKFAEEKEWRIIAVFKTTVASSRKKFRAGNTMVVPYIEVALPVDGTSLAIDKVYVGPTDESTLSAASVEMLLKSRNVKYSEVRCSTIPYRAS